MAFCLHYENVEDVFLHDWGAYQVGLSVPPTQYISSSEMRVGGWRGWIFLYVCVQAVGYVCGVGNKITFPNLISYLSSKDSVGSGRYSLMQGRRKSLKTVFINLAFVVCLTVMETKTSAAYQTQPGRDISGFINARGFSEQEVQSDTNGEAFRSGRFLHISTFYQYWTEIQFRIWAFYWIKTIQMKQITKLPLKSVLSDNLMLTTWR